jgi:hypothetical protein
MVCGRGGAEMSFVNPEADSPGTVCLARLTFEQTGRAMVPACAGHGTLDSVQRHDG